MLSRVVLVKILREGFDLVIGHFTMWLGSMTCQNLQKDFQNTKCLQSENGTIFKALIYILFLIFHSYYWL